MIDAQRALDFRQRDPAPVLRDPDPAHRELQRVQRFAGRQRLGMGEPGAEPAHQRLQVGFRQLLGELFSQRAEESLPLARALQFGKVFDDGGFHN